MVEEPWLRRGGRNMAGSLFLLTPNINTTVRKRPSVMWKALVSLWGHGLHSWHLSCARTELRGPMRSHTESARSRSALLQAGLLQVPQLPGSTLPRLWPGQFPNAARVRTGSQLCFPCELAEGSWARQVRLAAPLRAGRAAGPQNPGREAAGSWEGGLPATPRPLLRAEADGAPPR